MRSVDAAKGVLESMKASRNFVYRYLEKVIEACEMATAIPPNPTL